MKKLVIAFMSSSLLLFGIGKAASADNELVTNGGFETGELSGRIGGGLIIPSGSGLFYCRATPEKHSCCMADLLTRNKLCDLPGF